MLMLKIGNISMSVRRNKIVIVDRSSLHLIQTGTNMMKLKGGAVMIIFLVPQVIVHHATGGRKYSTSESGVNLEFHLILSLAHIE